MAENLNNSETVSLKINLKQNITAFEVQKWKTHKLNVKVNFVQKKVDCSYQLWNWNKVVGSYWAIDPSWKMSLMLWLINWTEQEFSFIVNKFECEMLFSLIFNIRHARARPWSTTLTAVPPANPSNELREFKIKKLKICGFSKVV